MMKEINLFENGANWVKCDFHLHSPFVDSFTLPSGINFNSINDIEWLIDQYLNKLKEKEIKICSITDYQQIRTEWFTKFQSKAKENEIYVFPGIELSINYGKGLHILLIFEYDEKIDGINDYIKALDQNPQKPLINEDRSHRDINLSEDLKIVIEKLKTKFNCLVIFPHPNDKNGIVNSFQPKEAAELIKYADAIEYIDDNDKKRLIDTNVIKKDFFDRFAIIENTDPKSLEEIGNKQRNNKVRTTYLKLSSASINGIKLALHDPQLRVRIYKKPEKINDRIISIKINGSTFLKDIELKLNPDLNTFIGGRGVGKSAIIESIRYCLAFQAYADRDFKEEFVKNVVGSGGTIELEIEKYYGENFIPYKVKRVIGQFPIVEGKEIEPQELFGNKIPLILGQKELYALSLNDNFQLSLIDNLIGDEIKKEELEFKKLLQQLEDNGQQLLQLSKQIQKKNEIEQEIKTINEHLKTFEDLGVAQKMAKHTNLIQDDKRLNQSINKLKELLSRQQILFEETINDLEKQIKTLNDACSVEKNVLINTANMFEQFKNYIKSIKNDYETKTETYSTVVNNILNQWQENKKKYDDEINNIKKELSLKGLAPDKYEELVKRKTQLEPLIGEYEKINRDIKELSEKRKNLKQQLKDKRHQLFEIRKNSIENINKKLEGKIKIDVEYLSNKEKFRNKFTELVKGTGFSKEAINNIIQKDAIDGIEISKLIMQDINKRGIDKVREEFGLTDIMANKLIETFKNIEKLFYLETLFPEDKIIINLKVDNEYKPLDKLSAGQKATALLILLFAQEDRIIIIDQPEEDLDNRFIYEDVVKILRDIKTKIQIILVTHNANIPVLGDAEQVFVLDTLNNQCKVIDTGSIDKNTISENIKKIMEGGEEAFKRRIEKYGVKL